ncbi:MAG: hypothetical protein EB160_09260 [Nitrososphaeria archaeon]|nr:hypothetical protein [Nitrososphaeria archaeon]
MSSSGDEDERRRVVSRVATKFFGTEILPESIIGETLERVTNPSASLEDVNPLLAKSIKEPIPSADFEIYRNHPVAVWVELNMGIEVRPGKPPRRAKPISLKVASEQFAKDAGNGVTKEQAAAYLKKFLLAAYEVKYPEDPKRSFFAFRLHQFIKGAGTLAETALRGLQRQHLFIHSTDGLGIVQILYARQGLFESEQDVFCDGTLAI